MVAGTVFLTYALVCQLRTKTTMTMTSHRLNPKRQPFLWKSPPVYFRVTRHDCSCCRRQRHHHQHHLLLSVTMNKHGDDERDSMPLKQVIMEHLSSSLLQEEEEKEKNHQSISSAKRRRFLNSLPQMLLLFRKHSMDELDSLILKTAIPNMLNLGVVPIVNAVDTFWVGRLGVALALAGQAAANQASFTLFFLISFLPNITAPLVASAVASGNQQEARQRVSESLFLCTVLGAVGTLALMLFPRPILTTLVVPPSAAPVLAYATPYLRWRALGMVPSLIAATGFAAYRGMLDTMTPLKVSLATNACNLVLDPWLMLAPCRMGFIGAAVATAASELVGGWIYLRLLVKRKWIESWTSLWRKPPSWQSILPLLQGGASMLVRQLALNVGFLVATRRAQHLDPSGISGAAYGIVMQLYSVGIILLVAMQSTTAALIPSSIVGTEQDNSIVVNDDDSVEDVTTRKEKEESEKDEKVALSQLRGRLCADRLFGWSTLVGILLAGSQFLLLPLLVPLFSTLPQVQEATMIPALIASGIHLVNGPIFAGEGYMMGLGCYKDLAWITAIGIITMIGCLASPVFGRRLDGIMWSIFISSIVQAVGVTWHYLRVGPLSSRGGGGGRLQR